MNTDEIRKWGFGDDKTLANRLRQLVLDGTKTATTGLYKSDKKISKAGDFAEIVDSNNKSFCIIEYTNIEVKKFLDVQYEFAVKEGENDKTIEEWRDSHRAFFKREYLNEFTDDSLVVCEEFKVIKVL
jgi:uncharacterized protein YhfF